MKIILKLVHWNGWTYWFLNLFCRYAIYKHRRPTRHDGVALLINRQYKLVIFQKVYVVNNYINLLLPITESWNWTQILHEILEKLYGMVNLTANQSFNCKLSLVVFVPKIWHFLWFSQQYMKLNCKVFPLLFNTFVLIQARSSAS